jgi:putative membrane protein
MRFLIRLLINALALYAAIVLVPGIELQATGPNRWVAVIVLALVFGLLNALLRPLLMILTCPFIILTLGLGTLLINTLLFYLSGLLTRSLGWGITINGFWPAFLGAIVVSIVSIFLSMVIKEPE